MKIFRYTVISRSGDKLAGEMEAVSRDNVLAHLHGLGHLPVDVSEAGSKVFSGSQEIPFFSNRPSASQITLFTHELAMLLKAGLPLDQSLDLLAKEGTSKKLSRLISAVNAKVSEGSSLNEALAAQGDSFPPIYTNMVRIAESTGTLDSVLARIADTRQRTEKLKSKALSAVLYPGLLIVMAIGAVTIMLTFVVPRFKQMILQAGTEVPDSARLVIASSDWLIANGQNLVLAICASIIALIFMWRRPPVRRVIESMLLRLPLVGNIMRLNLGIRFCRTLGVLLENGVDLPASMKLVRDVIGNKSAALALEKSYDSLRKGRSFLEPLAQSQLFPPVVITLLRVGEETGGLTDSSLHLADMFEDKLETTVQRTFTILEPVIILLVSGFIAAIIISILGAVISINDLAI